MRNLFIIVGPSGAGKDTLIAGALARRDDLHAVRRMITRPRDGESEDHLSCDDMAFDRMQHEGAFSVTWRAHGLRYGIPKSETDREGIVLMNGSRSALGAIVRAHPEAQVIVIDAPEEVLVRRLTERGRESAEDIRARLERGRITLPDGIEAQVVMNDASPETGIARLLAALQPESG